MPKPLIFTLFGGTGDLAVKKIVPALYNLFSHHKISSEFSLTVFSRRSWTSKQYVDFIAPYISTQDSKKREEFFSKIIYVQGELNDKKSYQALARVLGEHKEKFAEATTLCYMAVRPEFYKDILFGLNDNMSLRDADVKLLVEKPFGYGEKSARDFENQFEKIVAPDQVLRVDHYLAKEGLRDMLEQKSKNPDLQNRLNNKHIASIHVRLLETIGIEGRGEFYEHVGALRDVGQNHVLEMLAAFVSRDITNENKARQEVLESLTVVGDPIVAQYEGYTQEKNVAPDSCVETYFKIEVKSSLPAWHGVQIILEGGKAMPEKKADITVVMKTGETKVFDIQKSVAGKDAYEILIEQTMHSNPAYFASFEEVIAGWKIVDPILKNRDTLAVKKYSKRTKDIGL